MRVILYRGIRGANSTCFHSMGGQDRWVNIRAERKKLEGEAVSLAEQAKDKVASAVDEAKKTVS